MTAHRKVKPTKRHKYRLYVALFAACVLVIGGCVWLLLAQAEPPLPLKNGAAAAASITVLTNRRLADVPKQFVGFSMEASDVCSFLHAQRQHPEINTLAGNLQPYVLRIGGISADNMSWDAAAPDCGNWFVSHIGRTAINGLFAYARKNDVQILWTVNFKNNEPAAAAEEAAYIGSVGGTHLLGIAIGNEPNEYKKYTYTELAGRWYSYFSPIHDAAPAVPVFGPDTSRLFGCASCQQAYFQPFVQSYAQRISAATMHYYPESGKTATIASLLSQDTVQSFVKTIQALEVAKQGNVPLLIDETNSAYGGGRHGVSDTFAAALWGLDYLYTAAENGIQGVYFHGSMGVRDGAYTPIGISHSGIYAKPVYYAMLLFHQAAPEGALVQTMVHSRINVTAHTVAGTDDKLYLTIINKDLVTGAAVSASLPDGYNTAAAIRLEAPAANAAAGSVTLGGSPILPGGKWRASITERPLIQNGSLSLTVPAASAVLVTLHK